MDNRKRHTRLAALRPPRPNALKPDSLDWPAWLALIERKRRFHRRSGDALSIPAEYFVLATCSSFELDGLFISAAEVGHALAHDPARRKFRSRADQRIRNHIAILHSIEAALRLSEPLRISAVVRWYTSISSGLSTTEMSSEKMSRLQQIMQRINSPQLRLQAALQEIARTHAALLSDPLFHSFNGILARLLLRYHLGRCGLPFVVFDQSIPPSSLAVEQSLLLCLLTGIDEAYGMLRR